MKKMPALVFLALGILIFSCRQKAVQDPSNGIDPSASAGLNGGQANYIRSPLIDQFISLKNTIIARNPELESEKDRSSKLFNLLMANTTLGCAANVVVRTVEFKIEGGPLNNVLVTRNDGNFTPALSQEMFTFGIGNQDFSVALEQLNNELQNQAFGPSGGRTFFFPNSTVKLGQISRVRIRKLNSAYDIRDICNGKSDCPFQKNVTEIRRYGMYSLEIKVNGLTIYKQSNLAHAFASHISSAPSDQSAIHATSLDFNDSYAALNEAYIQAMTLNECSMYQ